MSAFDDLLNLGSGDGSGQAVLAPTSGGGGSSGSGDLLDLGFDAPVTTQNGNSKLTFEANTNPLYELSNSPGNMEGEANNPLFDLGVEPQKDIKADTSSGNPLYDYFQNDTNGTNGHGEDVLMNGNGNNDVDLLGFSSEPMKPAVTSDDSGVTVDSNNLSESNVEEDLIDTSNDLKDLEPEPVQDNKPEPEVELEPVIEQEPVVQQEPVVEQEPVIEQEPDIEQEPIVEVDTKVEEAPVVEAEQEQVIDEVQQQEPEAAPETEPEVVEEQEEEEQPGDQPTPESDLPEGSAAVTDQSQGPDDNANVESKQETTTEAPVEGVQNSEQPVEVKAVPMMNGLAEADKTDGIEEFMGTESPAVNDAQAVDEAPEAESEPKVVEPVEDKVDEPEPEIVEQAAPTETEQVQPDIAEELAQTLEAEHEPKPADIISTEPVEEVPEKQPEVDQVFAEPVADTPVEQDEADMAPEESPAVVEEPTPEPAKQEEVVVEENAPVEEPVEVPAEPEAVPEPTVEVKEEETPVELKQTEPEAVPEPTVEVKEEETPVELEQTEPEAVPEPNVEVKQDEAPVVPEPVVEVKEEAPVEEPSPPEVAPEPVVEVKEEAPAKTEPAVSKEEPKPAQSPVAETKDVAPPSETTENGVAKVNGTSEVKENGMSEEEMVRDPSIFRETREKEEIHFAEMNNFRQKFESGKIDDKEPEVKKKSVKEEYDAGGEFENEPVKNPDVISEADRATEDLPEVGTAKNLVDKFKTISAEKAQPVRSQKRESPARQEKVEYESTPTERLVIEEGKSDMGEFESTPQTREDVVRSEDRLEDAQPEKGYAKNILNKFKDIQANPGSSTPPREKRELTPDKSGKVEYVSEPRGQKIEYEENRVDTGVFENQPSGEEDVVRSGDKTEEVMPESGLAKNLLSKFKQMESEVGNRPPPSPKREVRAITPDKSGKTEYTSEPRGTKVEYDEQKEDQGVFESKPTVPAEVVRSEDAVEDYKPEPGMTKKAMERYKDLQNQTHSPSSAGHKEFTPPREGSPGKTVAGVVENTPSEAREDVVRSGERKAEELPEQGSAKNILNKFKEIQSSAGSSPIMSPTKKQKEITPPPESGVYENTPDDHLVIEPQKAFEGVLESTPSKSQADVARDYVHSPEREIPESGMAKNLVSKFRQLETSAKTSSSTSPKFKEFTPPRDRGPLSPKSPIGHPTDGVNLQDLPGQYQQQEQPGVFENEPEVKPDVYREADTDWTAGMPEKNTTMSMLEKFKSIQKQAKENEQTPAPVSRKEEPVTTQPEPEAKNIQHE